MADTHSTGRKAKLPKGVYRRRNKDGAVYLALVRLKGFRPVSRTFPTASEAVAWAEATKRELGAERERGQARPDLPKLTVGGLIREYLADPVTKELRSFETYHDRLDWWVAQYGAVRILDLSVLTLREARGKLIPGRAPATVNRHLAAMRAVWNWGRAAGLVPSERTWPTKLMLTEPKGRTRYLSDVELTRLLQEARARGPTEHAMVIVSLATGVRQSELLRLTWSDIDFERNRARVLLSKNGESRRGPPARRRGRRAQGGPAPGRGVGDALLRRFRGRALQEGHPPPLVERRAQPCRAHRLPLARPQALLRLVPRAEGGRRCSRSAACSATSPRP